jgi:Uncharacterized secreted protein
MKTALAALAPLFFGILLSGGAFAGTLRPVVVELYTSQGCNTCLPASNLAAKLAQKPGVLLLSFSVTYWDMFGWKDTLGSEDNSRRQKSYAGALRRGGVYTPQMIVDGVRDVPASRPDAVSYALEMAAMSRDDGYEPDTAAPAALTKRDGPVAVIAGTRLKTPARTAWSAGVNLTRQGENLRVAIDRAPERRRLDATVWLFRIRSTASVKITGGENAGQTVNYRNVVTGIQNLGAWHGEARSFDVAKPAAGKVAPYDGVAVVVQQGGYGRILGAALSGAN